MPPTCWQWTLLPRLPLGPSLSPFRPDRAVCIIRWAGLTGCLCLMTADGGQVLTTDGILYSPFKPGFLLIFKWERRGRGTYLFSLGSADHHVFVRLNSSSTSPAGAVFECGMAWHVSGWVVMKPVSQRRGGSQRTVTGGPGRMSALLSHRLPSLELTINLSRTTTVTPIHPSPTRPFPTRARCTLVPIQVRSGRTRFFKGRMRNVSPWRVVRTLDLLRQDAKNVDRSIRLRCHGVLDDQ